MRKKVFGSQSTGKLAFIINLSYHTNISNIQIIKEHERNKKKNKVTM